MIYLDSAATTKPCQAAVDAAMKTMETFGNPSSLHRLGIDAEKLVEKARECVARRLDVDKKYLYFTSGGTEANNTAILGAAYGGKRRGSHLITTAIEHPSVLETFKRLEDEGFSVTYLKPDANGIVSLEALKNALTRETILVSVMYVNNETGMIQPVDRMKPIIREVSDFCMLHSDMVQAFGKLPCKPKRWGIDMATVSAHKIHGLKGTGALYVEKAGFRSLLMGGEQQKGIRPGTENVAGIAAFGAACAQAEENSAGLTALREQLKNGILREIDQVRINGDGEENSGAVLNVSFLGTRAEILLHSLERHEIYVSTGSACSSRKPQPSHVLRAMELSPKEIEGAVRFSFDKNITSSDIDKTVEALKQEVAAIRRYVR